MNGKVVLMDKKTITHKDIMRDIVDLEMIEIDDTGEGIFDILTEYGYTYSNIPEATIRDLRPELIY